MNDWKFRTLNILLVAACLVAYFEYESWPDKSDIVCKMTEIELFRGQKALQKKVNEGNASVNDCEMLTAYKKALARIGREKDDVDDATLTITNATMTNLVITHLEIIEKAK